MRKGKASISSLTSHLTYSVTDRFGRASKLTTINEGSEEKTLVRRTAVRASDKTPTGGPGVVLTRNKMFYRSESINIMDESHRPAWKHGTNFIS